jgi:hypothetical protein
VGPSPNVFDTSELIFIKLSLCPTIGGNIMGLRKNIISAIFECFPQPLLASTSTRVDGFNRSKAFVDRVLRGKFFEQIVPASIKDN